MLFLSVRYLGQLCTPSLGFCICMLPFVGVLHILHCFAHFCMLSICSPLWVFFTFSRCVSYLLFIVGVLHLLAMFSRLSHAFCGLCLIFVSFWQFCYESSVHLYAFSGFLCNGLFCTFFSLNYKYHTIFALQTSLA